MAQTIRRSYKHCAPFGSGFLSVGSIHKIHYEQYGNKDGKPGKLPDIFRYAGLELILTVVFLHGGPGGSTSLKNTIFFNPSVQTHPEAVVSLTLRGISFFEAQEEIDFNEAFQCTRRFHPELYEELIGHLTEEERKDVAGSYAKRFSCGDHAVELAAMKVYD